MKWIRHHAAIIAVVAVSTAIALVAAEIGLRVAYLKDPWVVRNFTVDPVNQQVINVAIEYDPLLAYIPRPGYRAGEWYNNGEMGVRLNRAPAPGAPNPPVPKGGILAMGSSFTYGSEVKDHESWPAQLEAILRVPVVNAGAGGYALDQVMLRAERLTKVLDPKMVVIGFAPGDIGTNGVAMTGGLVKPYFDIENGQLVLRNVPVPIYQPSMRHVGLVRLVFGYSYALALAAERLGLEKFWLMYTAEVRRVHTNGPDVTCLLLQRFAKEVAGRNIALAVLAQYGGTQVNGHDGSRDYHKVEQVLGCARNAGYIVVDSYGELRRIFESDPVGFWRHWVKHPSDREWHSGHMSPEGNRLTAEILAKAIRTNAPAIAQQ